MQGAAGRNGGWFVSETGPRVSGTTSHQQGRFVLSALGHPFVADQAARHGGPGGAAGAAELFLASLIACAFGIMQRTAREAGLKLQRIECEAGYVLDPTDRTRFQRITMDFTVAGLDQAGAEGLVAAFMAQCPIYNTAARTTPTNVSTTVAA